MKKILLPTDFSDNAFNAINYAMQFFKNEVCHFYILHVQKASHYITDDLMTASSNTTIHESVVEVTKKKLQQIVEELKVRYVTEDYTFHTLIDYDVLVDAFKQVIRSKNIDMIIMGTNGITGAEEALFGSNTINVIRKIDCPVIIIPQGFKFTTPKTILYAIDHNDHFVEDDHQLLSKMIDKHQSSLKILRIKNDDSITISEFEDKKSMRIFFKNQDHTFHSITNVPAALAINSFVQIMDIDMTAMFVKKETFFKRFFKGSNTSKISYGTRVPLLIMHTRT